MKRHKQHFKSVLLLTTLSCVLVACVFRKITYNVPDGKHLLTSNEVLVEGNEELAAGIEGVIRQQPNLSAAGIRVRLRVFNAIDSTKAANKQQKRVNKYYRVNYKRATKDNKENSKRIAKAQADFPKTLRKHTKINSVRKKRAAKKNAKKMARVEKHNAHLTKKKEKFKDSKGHKRIKAKRLKKFIPYKPELLDTIPMIHKKNRFLFTYKDTTNIRPTWRMRMKYKFGEAPVIADTALMGKSKQQIKAYLRSKGYYEPKIEAHFDTLFKVKRGEKRDVKKIKGSYSVVTGERFIIDSVLLKCPNESVAQRFYAYTKKITDVNGLNTYFKQALVDHKPVSFPFDANQLDAYRYEVAAYMADSKFYGFTEQNVFYKVDTIRSHNSGDHRMRLTIGFSNRLVETENKEVVEVQFVETMIKGVIFEISDTTYFENYTDSLKKNNIDISKEKYLPTFDTYYYDKLLTKVENKDDGTSKKTYFKSSVNKGLFGGYKDSVAVNPFRLATFKYNGEIFTNPALIECQNYLENGNYYKAYYVDRSYTRMQQLGLFSQVDWELIEKKPGSGFLEVHYKLVPATRQSFSFLPKATTVNGFLGLSASFNYSNINLFKTGTKMNFTLGTGFEQNSTIVQSTPDSKFFNTIEIGPALKFDIPGLFPFPVTVVGKRQRPRTELGAAVNYQQRQDFTRSLVQFDWNYKFAAGDGKTQNFGIGIIAPTVKVVSISKKDYFTERINQLNDLFLKNAYNNQLIWEDAKFTFSYDNLSKDKDDKKFDRLRLTFNSNLNFAGYFMANALSLINRDHDVDGRRLLFGIPFSQFSLIDSKLIANVRYSKTKALAFRLMAGYGLPGKNSNTSLPYDYSFSSGGANDIRGWEARQLGPGKYLSLLDPNAVATQIGDIRLESSIEYRFGSGIFNHAFFADAGNTWTYKNDPLRPGSQMTNDFYKQIALSVGYGLRLDFDFFIFRIDMGLPVYNPTMPDGTRWIYEKHTAYNDMATTIFGADYKTKLDKFQINPFRPHFHFGIGLPF